MGTAKPRILFRNGHVSFTCKCSSLRATLRMTSTGEVSIDKSNSRFPRMRPHLSEATAGYTSQESLHESLRAGSVIDVRILSHARLHAMLCFA